VPEKKLPPADPERFDEAVDAFRKRVPMTRDAWDELNTAERERAFMVSEVTLASVVADVWEAMDAAIANGGTYQEFAATAGAALTEHWGGEKPGRLETIFRTNLNAAYNEGRHEILTAPAVKEARPFWRLDGVDDDRQSEICRRVDGTVLPADDSWWKKNSPPRHFNCRCIITPLTEDDANDEGVDDEPPRVPPQEGFGAQPSSTGQDWEPDLTAFPEEIAAQLAKRLKGGTSG
jgi:SPP1 gp7 family putative phage head morphogenesis protein